MKEKLKEFDHLYNVEWPMVQLLTTDHYLNEKGKSKHATGGSEWKKYLHLKYQLQKFFPTLWTEKEKKTGDFLKSNWQIDDCQKSYFN